MALGIENEALADLLARSRRFSLQMLAYLPDERYDAQRATLWQLSHYQSTVYDVVTGFAAGVLPSSLTPVLYPQFPDTLVMPRYLEQILGQWQHTRVCLTHAVRCLPHALIHISLQSIDITLSINEIIKRLVGYEYQLIKQLGAPGFEQWFLDED